MAQSKCIPDYEANILKELRCPVCYEFMLPPIRLCQGGHNICDDCRPKLQHCPTCRQKILEVTNISLEILARETYFPCRNLKSGCNQYVTFTGLRKHQVECSFGNYRCPFAKIAKDKCDWCGRLPDIIKHIKEAHKAKAVTLNSEGWVYFQFKVPSLHSFLPFSSSSSAILGHENLFYVVFRITGNKFSCVVMHVGARNEALKFKYRLSLSSEHEDVTFSLITASFMDDVDNIFKDENCLAVLAFSRFKKSDRFQLKIEILKYEEEEKTKETEEENNKEMKELTFV